MLFSKEIHSILDTILMELVSVGTVHQDNACFAVWKLTRWLLFQSRLFEMRQLERESSLSYQSPREPREPRVARYYCSIFYSNKLRFLVCTQPHYYKLFK